MSNSLNFEYEVLKHYIRKGIFARSKQIATWTIRARELSKQTNRNTQHMEHDLNDNEKIAVAQLAAVANLMMLIEDFVIICHSIKNGEIDYYKYLDNKGDDELGTVIEKFFDNINNFSDQDICKMLSYGNLDSFDFLDQKEKEILGKISDGMIKQTRVFLNKLALFRHNHIKIFRRYKHAGFPIFLAQQLPPDPSMYKNFEFVTVGLTSREHIDKELSTLPYSLKVLESYDNLAKDIIAIFGTLITYKMICIERNIEGVPPSHINQFGLTLKNEEIETLQKVWEKFESKHSLPTGKTNISLKFLTEYYKWYTDIDDTSKRVF